MVTKYKNHEFLPQTYDHDKIYILRAEYRDMSNISKEEFVSFMRKLLDEVFEEYAQSRIKEHELRKPSIYENIESRYLNDYRNKRKIASYKRESSKEKFIASLKEMAMKEVNNIRVMTDISFDLMPVLYYSGLPCFSGVDKNFTDEQIAYVYDKMEDIIKQSEGVVFKFHCDISTMIKYPRASFRPWIEFALPDDMMKKFEDKQIERQSGIQRFYDDLGYKGD